MNRVLQRLEEGKLYYSISEVSRMTGLEAHVLRYWETEFSQMRPRKNRAGNRAYRQREIQYIQYIRHLLHEEKYTLQGAKKKLAEVSFDEVAGQTTLLKATPAEAVPPILPQIRGSGPGEGSTAKASHARLTAEQKRELVMIRRGLKDVLRLVAKNV